MRVAWLAVAVLGLLLVAVPVSTASANCSWVQVQEMVSGTVRIKWTQRCGSVAESGRRDASLASPTNVAPRDSDWDTVCVRTALTVGASPQRFCSLPLTPGSPGTLGTPPPQLTTAMVARALRTIDLPASELQIQPPHGRTLVNFDTNFYTEQPAFDRTVRLLGRQVELHIWPSQFRWVFGDGAELPSTSAGAPYPDLLITHSYLQKGGVSPRVDTTYAASFRVDGGAWRDVDGTVTIPGEPVPLEVVTARPVLVGEN